MSDHGLNEAAAKDVAEVILGKYKEMFESGILTEKMIEIASYTVMLKLCTPPAKKELVIDTSMRGMSKFQLANKFRPNKPLFLILYQQKTGRPLYVKVQQVIKK